jgi:hypothetical protein
MARKLLGLALNHVGVLTVLTLVASCGQSKDSSERSAARSDNEGLAEEDLHSHEDNEPDEFAFFGTQVLTINAGTNGTSSASQNSVIGPGSFRRVDGIYCAPANCKVPTGTAVFREIFVSPNDSQCTIKTIPTIRLVRRSTVTRTVARKTATGVLLRYEGIPSPVGKSAMTIDCGTYKSSYSTVEVAASPQPKASPPVTQSAQRA